VELIVRQHDIEVALSDGFIKRLAAEDFDELGTRKFPSQTLHE
jgi:hypothetical protein